MKQSLRGWLIMAAVSVSGGTIFWLPFIQEVFYKPLMEALNLSNAQVGGLMSAFGTTSMLCYFPGGWLADRISSRVLMTASLLSTGVAGLYFATFPPYFACLAIHAFWGISITLLFWGAMIRVTRDWASHKDQGKAFGILESGRGLGENLSMTALLAVFAYLGSGLEALSTSITALSWMTIALGALTWFLIEDSTGQSRESRKEVGLREIGMVLRLPAVWLIAAVIFCSYCAFWGMIRLTSYSTDVFALSVTIAAAISVGKLWLKPVSAVLAGFVSDRFGVARTVRSLLIALTLCFLLFAFLPGEPGLVPVMLINVAVGAIAVSALRGIYFALLEEGAIPMVVTGTAAGVISVIAYTPDIFAPYLGGMLIDTYPGAPGYRIFFLTIATICLAGALAAWAIMRRKPAI